MTAPLPTLRRRQKGAQSLSGHVHQDRRRITLPDGELVRELLDRAEKTGTSLMRVVQGLCTAALEYERNPAPADSPLERRIRKLLKEDPLLSRASATKIAQAGNHHR